MTTPVSGPVVGAGSLDDQIAARLLHERIIVLGTEVDDAIANRLCAQLLLWWILYKVPEWSRQANF